jgi:predicted metal-dependent HD superfamily phosphohydrolase
VKPAEQLRLSDPPTPSTIAASHDDPLHVFLDLDLSILGHPDTSVYRERYAANIGREYSHYPPADFLKGRSAFLNSFLCDAQWYKTPYFFARLEATARRNVATEAAELTAQLKELTATTPPAC